MAASSRLVVFAALLALAFGAAAALGGIRDPERPAPEAGHGQVAAVEAAHDGEAGPSGGDAPRHGDDTAPHRGAALSGASTAALPGLAAEQDGFALELQTPRPAPGRARAVAFRIVDRAGRPVRDFELAHEKRMHVIDVSRDLRTFEHLHPTRDADGRWSTVVDLRRPGTYRLYADFTVGGRQRTLGGDLHVAGAFAPRRLPGPAAVVRDDRGLEVRLIREGARASFEVLRDGRVVNDELEPYLGAKGHLVTLRASDLAYLHTHPEGDALAFEVEAPSPGTYRHHVQFQLAGKVHTASFTEEVPR
jgi:hypothetical protein